MRIAMKLMQKSTGVNGVGAAYDEIRWPTGCNAVDFLAKIQVARSFDELLDVSRPCTCCAYPNSASTRFYSLIRRRRTLSGWCLWRQSVLTEVSGIMSR
jgi:hypothetical protein